MKGFSGVFTKNQEFRRFTGSEGSWCHAFFFGHRDFNFWEKNKQVGFLMG